MTDQDAPEMKDRILKYLNTSENRETSFRWTELRTNIFPDGSVNQNNMITLLGFLVEDGYILQQADKIKLDLRAVSFIKSGGYSGEELRKKTEAEAKYQNEIYDAKLSKWQVILFWIITPITLIGSILGIIAFFKK